MPRFAINRPDGSIAIDSNYYNLALRQKGRLMLTSQPSGNTPHFRSETMTLAGDQAIIAFRAPKPVAMYRSFKTGNSFQFTFAGQSGDPIPVDWWLFDLPQYGISNQSGGKLIVRRPQDGTIAFDSRMSYLKVMDFVQPTGPDRRSYAKLPATVMVNRNWVDSSNTSPIGPGVRQKGSGMVWTEGNDVVYQFQTTELYPTDSSAANYSYAGGKAVHLVVDVQDY